MKIVQKIEKPLLQRTEVTIELESPVTPSNVDVRKQIAAKMGAKEDVIVMKKIATDFGSTKVKATAYIYTDAKAKAKFEPTTSKMREATKKAAEAAAAAAKEAAEAKAAEKPAEGAKT